MLILKLAHVNRVVFATTIAVALALPALLLGTAAWPILMWIFFLMIPINWMMSGYKRSTSAKLPLTYGTIGILVVFFLILIAAINLYPQGWAHFIAAIERDMIATTTRLNLGMSEKMVSTYAELAVQMIPAVFVLVAMGIAGLLHTIARRVFKTYKVLLPELKISEEWRVPKSWVLLFVISYIAQRFINPGGQSFLALAGNNLTPLLMLALTVQAFGFLHVLSRTKKWATILKVLAAILVLPATPLVAIVGMIDALTPLRERFTKQEG